MQRLILWDIYQITSEHNSLTGIKLRGTLRKFSLDNGFNFLTDNASDQENCVRFALIADEEKYQIVYDVILKLLPTAKVEKVLEAIPNPVLSKMKVNNETRYEEL